MIKICAKCGIEFTPSSNCQKRCKSCAFSHKLQHDREIRLHKREKQDGTFGASPIRNKDNSINFTVEHAAIIKEMKRLGLRQQHD